MQGINLKIYALALPTTNLATNSASSMQLNNFPAVIKTHNRRILDTHWWPVNEYNTKQQQQQQQYFNYINQSNNFILFLQHNFIMHSTMWAMRCLMALTHKNQQEALFPPFFSFDAHASGGASIPRTCSKIVTRSISSNIILFRLGQPESCYEWIWNSS